MNSTPLITDKEREYPNSHLLQLLCLVAFFAVWSLDSLVFRLSISLSYYIPLVIRLGLFFTVLIAAIALLQLAHDSLFDNRVVGEQEGHDHHHPDTLVDSGILARVRHPLYLGIVLVYFSFVLVTLSIASLVTWMVIFIIYDRMATFEEKQLIVMFGQEYEEYKRRVPKYLPRW